MGAIPILVEDYLRKEILKANRPQTDEKLNELINHFAQRNKHERFHIIQKWQRNLVPKTMQPLRHTGIEHSEEIKQSSNKIRDKYILNKHIIKELSP